MIISDSDDAEKVLLLLMPKNSLYYSADGKKFYSISKALKVEKLEETEKTPKPKVAPGKRPIGRPRKVLK